MGAATNPLRDLHVPSGWCDFGDVYRQWLRLFPETATVVEIGSYLGQSAVLWGGLARKRNLRTKLICIDPWLGVDESTIVHDEGKAEQRALLSSCGGSMRPAFDAAIAANQLQPWIDARTGTSVEHAATFADESVDAVLVDGDHAEASVRADLDAWWPKVKPGGEMVGHDDDWPSVRDTVRAWARERGLTVLPVSQRCWRLRKALPGEGWTVPEAVRVCLVAVCCSERSIYRETVKSLMQIGWGVQLLTAMRENGFTDIKFAWLDAHPRVDALREEATLLAFRAQASHILFLDADMTWPEDVLTRMLAHHDKGIVGGLYHLKKWPHWPVAFNKREWNARDGVWDYHYDQGASLAKDVRPEILLGMGCTLIPMRVFEQLPRPWWDYQRNEFTGLCTVTEDVTFCQAAEAAGVPIWLDPTIECGHVGQTPIGAQTHQRATFDLAWLEADGMPPLPSEVAQQQKVPA